MSISDVKLATIVLLAEQVDGITEKRRSRGYTFIEI
jgi:hypothetical protein